MSIPIGDTPALHGKAAEEWWAKVKSEEKIPFGYIPTPELDDLREEILANAKQRKPSMTKTIPFGEHTLSPAQVNRMGKALWEDDSDKRLGKWSELTEQYKESFIRDSILTIPKVLGVIGLKVVGK